MDTLLSVYSWLKVGHLASVIAWMAAMLYLPRLFIYHFQAAAGGEAAGFFKVMERRLLKGIMTPAMLASWVFAILMLSANPALFSEGWFLGKVALVIAMTGVHGFYAAQRKKFEAGTLPRSEKFWRLMNEVPFVIMLGILILVLVKPTF